MLHGLRPAANEREKQQMVWELLRQKLGEDVEAVSLVLAYGTDEL